MGYKKQALGLPCGKESAFPSLQDHIAIIRSVKVLVLPIDSCEDAWPLDWTK